MKLFLSGLIFIFSLSVMAAENKDKCGDTQAELNECSYRASKTAEAELNKTVKTIQEYYADDPVFLKNLKESQKRWVKFKEAEIAVMFPHYGGLDGSSAYMCEEQYNKQLINDRIAMLKRWIKGEPNDEMCEGSIKRQWQIWDIEDAQEIKYKSR